MAGEAFAGIIMGMLVMCGVLIASIGLMIVLNFIKYGTWHPYG